MEQKKITGWLTLLFYILVGATLITYFVVPDKHVMLYIGFGAIGVRLVTYFIRYFM